MLDRQKFVYAAIECQRRCQGRRRGSACQYAGSRSRGRCGSRLRACDPVVGCVSDRLWLSPPTRSTGAVSIWCSSSPLTTRLRRIPIPPQGIALWPLTRLPHDRGVKPTCVDTSVLLWTFTYQLFGMAVAVTPEKVLVTEPVPLASDVTLGSGYTTGPCASQLPSWIWAACPVFGSRPWTVRDTPRV